MCGSHLRNELKKTQTLRLFVRDETSRQIAIEEVRARPTPFALTCSEPHSKRNLEHNALQHVWYAQIEQQGQQMRAFEARRECKLKIGVPILRGDPNDATFRDRWDRLIAPRQFAYSDLLELMDWFPVTSLMRVEQMRTYLDTMQAMYAPLGIVLEGLPPKGYESYPEAVA